MIIEIGLPEWRCPVRFLNSKDKVANWKGCWLIICMQIVEINTWNSKKIQKWDRLKEQVRLEESKANFS